MFTCDADVLSLYLSYVGHIFCILVNQGLRALLPDSRYRLT